MDPTRNTPGRRRRWLAALALVAALLVAAGCGSDDDGGDSTAANGSDTASGGDVVAKAKAAYEPYLDPPDSIGVDPLSERPPEGKTIAAIGCTLDVCKYWRDQVADAAKNLGWTVKSYGFDGTPEDTLEKVQTAVDQKPDAIIINGVPRETYETAVAAAKERNIPIVTQSGELDGQVVDPFIAVHGAAPQFDRIGEATGNWVIAESDGKANALLTSYAGFPLSEYLTEATKRTIDDNCPDCKTKDILIKPSDAGTALPQRVVSEIQRDPSIDWIIFQDASMAAGVAAALREAGLQDKVNVVTNSVTPEYAQSVKDGEFLGFMAYSLRAIAYQGVDAVARHLVGDPQPDDLRFMQRLFVKDNLPADADRTYWENIPEDLDEQFREVWKVNAG